MSMLVELFPRKPAADTEPIGARETSRADTIKQQPDLPDEPIRSLVEQVFFKRRQGATKHVGFTTAEPSADTANLCYAAGKILAEQRTGDVALVDASVRGASVPERLNLPRWAQGAESQISERFWLVNRPAWLANEDCETATTSGVFQLRQIASQFDFSILCCDPMSPLTIRIGRACDGLVLVLTANMTRRVVATQMKEYLRSAEVPLLGTVLTERRFPIPERICRVL
jgi:hypothetical protein